MELTKICPSPPEDVLLTLVEKVHSLDTIRTIVKNNPGILKHEYPHPYSKTLLQIACSNAVAGIKPETIDILLELGADRYACTEINKAPAWHLAAASGRPDILKTILKGFNRDRINAVHNGSTALHVAIRNEKNHAESDVVKCIEVLVDWGIDVNKTDNKNLTPILIAAEKQYKLIVELLITRYWGRIDLDTKTNRRKQKARDIINNNKLYDGELPEKYVAPMRTRKDELDDYLKNNQEVEFIRCLLQETDSCQLEELCNSNNGNDTYLQYCCQHDLQTIANCLLESGADPNKTMDSNRELPITIAATLGNYEICENLLKRDNVQIPEDLLSITIISLPKKGVREESHKRYIEALFEKVARLQTDVCNHQDWKKSTPLHYACRYGNQNLILELLNRGASLACRNDFDQLAVADITAPTLKKHLDNCIEIPQNETALDPYVTVTYNYKSLVPPPKKSIANESDSAATTIDIDKDNNHQEAFIPNKIRTEDDNPETQLLMPEMDVILHMVESRELRELLKHPVITSFLYMKWHRIKKYFLVNFVFYISFCLSLVAYILFFYSDSEEQKLLEWILRVMLFLLVARETFQLIVAPKLYVINIENWIEVGLIAVTFFIICLEKPPQHTCKIFSSIGILLAALELILLIGQIPYMAENVTMLRTVSKTFFKFLVWYSILIIAFALSFFTLFKKDPNEEVPTKSKDEKADEEDKEDNFDGPFTSMFKTVIMLTGEFEAGELNFAAYPVTSRVIFILFVFMIAIILFNLLNGLAVSDTQTIRNDAQLVAQIARARHIAYYEKILMGSIMPRNLIHCIKRLLFSCTRNDEDNARTKPVRWNLLARRVCLFPKFLPQYKLTVSLSNNECHVIDPMHENKNRINAENTSKSVRKYWRITLDSYTTQETQLWLQEKKSSDSKEETMNLILEKLFRQEKAIDEIKKALSVLIAMKESE